jgi:hypothetical protein
VIEGSRPIWNASGLLAESVTGFVLLKQVWRYHGKKTHRSIPKSYSHVVEYAGYAD